MRIISGKFRGRTIHMPKGIRPTQDKVRGAIFEIFKDQIEGIDFLDLYCGSGAVGIEAFSRGAKSVAFVDNNRRCIMTLKKNLAAMDLLDLSIIDIYAMEVLRVFEIFEKSSRYFNIVFLDPPYYKDMAKNTLIALSDHDILARNAVCIVEVYKKDELPLEVGQLKRFRTASYGDTKLGFFRRF